MDKIVAIVDSNGERIEIPEGSRVVILDDPGDRVVRGNSIKRYKANNEKIWKAKIERITSKDKIRWKMRSYTMINDEEMSMLLDDGTLDMNKCGFIMCIAPFVLYESCKIAYPNGKKLSGKKMCDIAKVSYATGRKYIANLCQNRLLATFDGSYYINPWLVCKGNLIDSNLFSIFKDYYIRSQGMYWHDFMLINGC